MADEEQTTLLTAEKPDEAKATDAPEDKGLTKSPPDEAPKPDPDEQQKPEEKKADEPGAKEDSTKPPAQYDLKLPADALVSEAALEATVEMAKRLQLTNEGAQDFLDHADDFVQAFQKSNLDTWNAATEEWVEDIRKDSEIGGDKFDESIDLGRKAIDRFGTPELREALTATGLGNHPEFVRMCARIGAAMKEDSFIPGATGRSGPRDPADVLYPNQNKQE